MTPGNATLSSSASVSTTGEGRIPEPRLHVDRTGIVFENISPETIRIEVEVTNLDTAPSRPAPMGLEIAPFGGFLPWRPLAQLVVPPIPPRRSTWVTTNVPDPRRNSGLRSLLTGTLTDGRGPSVDDAMLQRSMHMAANVNVLIGQTAVERHMAQAIRLHPGCANIAFFIVGDRADEYAFTTSGSGASWPIDIRRGPRSLARLSLERDDLDSTMSAADLTTWIPAEPFTPFILHMLPPSDATEGCIEVHVRQRSTGREAVVEFSLDANAQGPGCYTV